MRTSPDHFEKIATQAEQDGRWTDAAEAWDNARAVSIGHNRRWRYAELATYCRTQAADNTREG